MLTLLSGCLLLAACCAAQVWYDNRADDLTKEGMLKGIEQAAAFILVSGLTLRCCSLLCRSQAFVCCARAWNRPPVPLRWRASAPLLPDGDQARDDAPEAHRAAPR